jgi:hypothetical protein
MFDKSRAALAAILAIGLTGSLVGSFVGPALAAPGQTCYFGECGPGATPARTEQAQPGNQAVMIGTHGNWKAMMVGQGAMIVDQFDNNAKFAILVYPEGKVGLMLSHPDWHLTKGQQVQMTINIDGHVFKGTAVAGDGSVLEVDGVSKELATAFYKGQKGRIEVGQYKFDMTNLADAAAAIDDVIHYKQTASR